MDYVHEGKVLLEKFLVFIYGDIFSSDNAIIILMTLFTLASYILLAIGLSEMAKRQGLSYPYAAWIPYVGMHYTMGNLISPKLGKKGGLKLAAGALVTVIVGKTLLTQPEVEIIGILLYFIFRVIELIVNFWLYQKYSNRPALHLLLSLMVPLYFALTVYAFRRNAPRT